MASLALYLKWRSQTFEELIGQEHVTRTLRNALERGRMSHAYLFCGPRGTGKTSMARILAKAVNCTGETEHKPCNQCAICLAINEGSLLDLIEIDAASNTSVDHIRDLREKVGFRPNQARFKVYVIDEVHMLSNAAFNALLKTLEEPPAHVMFVLATTEPHKIPLTIISRCQRFDFRFVPTSLIAAHLRKVADAEGMQIDDEALQLIATHAGGAVRDAVTLLDQLTAYGDAEITVDQVGAILGLSSSVAIAEFVEALVRRDLAAGLLVIDQMVDQGVGLRQFNAELLAYLRGMLLAKASGELRLLGLGPDARKRLLDQAKSIELPDLVRSARLFSDAAFGLRTSLQPQLPLELAFVEAVSSPAAPQEQGAPVFQADRHGVAPQDTTQPGVTEARPEAPAETPRLSGSQTSLDEKASQKQPGDVSSRDLLLTIRSRWGEVLRLVRPLDKEAEAFLRSAQPISVEGDSLLLSFKHDFHRRRFDSLDCNEIVSQTLSQVAGRYLTVKCTSEKAEKRSEAGGGGGRKSSQPAGEKRPAASAESPRKGPLSAGAAGSVNDVINDPLVRTAVDKFGARVRNVTPNAPTPDEPPLPEEPPPYDEF